MITEEIREELFSLSDGKYRDFQAPLIPSVKKERFIGVRTPKLRALAKKYSKREDIGGFLEDLPHGYFDEDQLHAFIISEMKDFGSCIEELERFLPYIDNWATCDQLSPKLFEKNRKELLPYIGSWIASGKSYVQRFGIGMLMQHFLDEDFDPSYSALVAALRSEEYYVNMMIAWYFATALAKQYEAAVRYIEEGKLDPWTHNKAIQKAVESYRISPEKKEYLKSLRLKKYGK